MVSDLAFYENDLSLIHKTLLRALIVNLTVLKINKTA